MRQMVLHLDEQLEYLLKRLKTGPGENAFNLVLAGGHGVPPEPAEESRKRMAVVGESVAQTVDRVAARQRRRTGNPLPVPVPVPGHQRLPRPRTAAPRRRAGRAQSPRGGRLLHRRRLLLHHRRLARTLPQQLSLQPVGRRDALLPAGVRGGLRRRAAASRTARSTITTCASRSVSTVRSLRPASSNLPCRVWTWRRPWRAPWG